MANMTSISLIFQGEEVFEILIPYNTQRVVFDTTHSKESVYGDVSIQIPAIKEIQLWPGNLMGNDK